MKSKTIIVMPAYNAAATLEKTLRDIPEGFADEIILVDMGDGPIKKLAMMSPKA